MQDPLPPEALSQQLPPQVLPPGQLYHQRRQLPLPLTAAALHGPSLCLDGLHLLLPTAVLAPGQLDDEGGLGLLAVERHPLLLSLDKVALGGSLEEGGERTELAKHTILGENSTAILLLILLPFYW